MKVMLVCKELKERGKKRGMVEGGLGPIGLD
jgi:hypothetical protein